MSEDPEPPALSDRPSAGVARRRWPLVLAITGGVLVVVAVAAIGFLAIGELGEEVPAVGECLTDGPAAEDMAVVECDADEAFWVVVGHDGTWTHRDFETSPLGEVCAEHPASQQALWVTGAGSVSDGTEGEVVCLEAISADES